LYRFLESYVIIRGMVVEWHSVFRNSYPKAFHSAEVAIRKTHFSVSNNFYGFWQLDVDLKSV